MFFSSKEIDFDFAVFCPNVVESNNNEPSSGNFVIYILRRSFFDYQNYELKGQLRMKAYSRKVIDICTHHYLILLGLQWHLGGCDSSLIQR